MGNTTHFQNELKETLYISVGGLDKFHIVRDGLLCGRHRGLLSAFHVRGSAVCGLAQLQLLRHFDRRQSDLVPGGQRLRRPQRNPGLAGRRLDRREIHPLSVHPYHLCLGRTGQELPVLGHAGKSVYRIRLWSDRRRHIIIIITIIISRVGTNFGVGDRRGEARRAESGVGFLFGGGAPLPTS